MNSDEQRAVKYHSDSRSTAELIRLVLNKDPDADNDEYWVPVWILQNRLPMILGQIIELSHSSEEKYRETAATILGQNGVKNKVKVQECLDRLLEMLRDERSPNVLASVAFACGHFHDRRSIEALLSLKSHPEPGVRYAVVHSLSGFENPDAIQALIELSADTDKDVRNWATFAIGSQIDTNTLEIRDALFARVQESDAEIRGEALVGLARRNDKRAIDPLLKEMDRPAADAICDRVLLRDAIKSVIDIVNETGENAWLPVLQKAKRSFPG